MSTPSSPMKCSNCGFINEGHAGKCKSCMQELRHEKTIEPANDNAQQAPSPTAASGFFTIPPKAQLSPEEAATYFNKNS